MKKILIISIMCLLGTSLSAQKIKKSEYDKFNKSKHIETSWVNVRKNVIDLNDVNAMLYAFGGNNYIRFKINNTTNIIPTGSSIILLDENGDTHEFVVSECSGGVGKGAISFMGSAKPGIEFLANGDLDILDNSLITAIRINSASGYVDYDIKKENSEKLQKAYKLFKKELEK